MKKLLFVLALGAFAACNSGETKAPAGDSTKVDSVKATVDTTAKAADTTKAAVDTTKK
ncbi:MAG: coproporphyrinogen III oxidase [Bacteroidota bacterium]